jgi:vacuolar-type H+-ATPase subunit C/Vma6
MITPEDNFDNVFLASNEEILSFLKSNLLPEHRIISNLIFFEENIHNFKVLLKSIILNKDLENLFIPVFYSYSELRDALNKQGYLEIDKVITLMLEKISEISQETGNMRGKEIVLENFYMKQIHKATMLTGRKMMIDYVKHMTDIINIKNINRVKNLGVEIDYDDFLLDNGFLSKEYLKSFKDQSNEFFISEFSSSEYSDIVKKGINSLTSYNTFFSFEKHEYIFYLNFFDSVKYNTANIEKIFSFFIRKKIELKILNIIYLGILFSIDKAKINHKVEILIEN